MVTDSTLLFLTPLQTLSAADLRDPEISALIAKKLREFHDLDMPGPKSVSLWQRLRKTFYSPFLSSLIKLWRQTFVVAYQELTVWCCMNQAVA
jgi:hypothetical protein